MTRRRIILLVLVLLLAVGAVAYLSTPKEPSYEGRSLSSWLKLAKHSFDIASLASTIDDVDDPDVKAARTAIRSMGTNALPLLIKWSASKDTAAGERVTRWINRYLPPRFQIWPAPVRRRAAEIGFQLLKEKARPAYPVFVQWTLDKDPERRRLGLECLAKTKPDHETILPVLHRMFDDPDKNVRACATSIFIGLYQSGAK